MKYVTLGRVLVAVLAAILCFPRIGIIPSLLIFFAEASVIVPILKILIPFGCVAKTTCESLAPVLVIGSFMTLPALALIATAILSKAPETKNFALNAMITWIAFSIVIVFANWEALQVTE